MNTLTKKIKHALHHDATPGILLILAMFAALIVANSGASWYGDVLSAPGIIGISDWTIEKPLLLWINDGLMAVFFLFVGLELKREVLFGELSDRRKIILPLCAAIGGIAVPAAIYVAFNWSDPVAIDGWAIPAATDIAFALGILAVLGSRVPVALKILLTSVAVLDDLAAIMIIALFYTSQLSIYSLGIAFLTLLGLYSLNRRRVRSSTPYVLLGIVLWVAVLKSGVHATLAGVALAAFIPAGPALDSREGLVKKMEKSLHPWVVFGILPVFAFANAGVSLRGITFDALLDPIPLGIALGLFVGKQIGVFGASVLAVKTGIAQLPKGVNWAQIYGLSILCGIGFTMSLFISSLAFETSGGIAYLTDSRIGILLGSFLSAGLGYSVLRYACRQKAEASSAIKTKGKKLNTPLSSQPPLSNP